LSFADGSSSEHFHQSSRDAKCLAVVTTGCFHDLVVVQQPSEEHSSMICANTRKGTLAAAISFGVLAALFTAPVAHADAVPGKPAPEFTAVDSNGKTHKLSDYKGKIVVLEWTNDGCPYVRKHYGAGNMQALQQEAADKGVVWLTVISSAKGEQGYVDGPAADKLTADRKAKPAAVLLDPSGVVGKAYGAKTTPHMYVIKADGQLAYNGAIDDKPTSNPADIKTARSYVKEALAAVAEGRPVAVATTRAYGCSVKYQ
jgi:peroxiredoxin